MRSLWWTCWTAATRHIWPWWRGPIWGSPSPNSTAGPSHVTPNVSSWTRTQWWDFWLGRYHGNEHVLPVLSLALSGAFKYRRAVWQRGAVGGSWPRLARLLQLRCVRVSPVFGDVQQAAGLLLGARQLRRWVALHTCKVMAASAVPSGGKEDTRNIYSPSRLCNPVNLKWWWICVLLS